jgi:hypothetical protein
VSYSKRFELEEKIMQAWQVTSDVELIYRKVTDEGLSEDELSNALLGIMTIYNLRFNDLFDTFEQMLKEENQKL